mmetsp:Transcript_31058/g.31570  ORF Transcript_31058/g.31570 Transcript_31058/m.31570 type:complete len:125 (-) Transcript_31058:147-521(-)
MVRDMVEWHILLEVIQVQTMMIIVVEYLSNVIQMDVPSTFDDLHDDADSLVDVVTNDDMSVILECTLTGDDDGGGLECTAIPDTENSKKDHDDHHHNNLVTSSSFDEVNVDSSRAATTSRVVVE